MLTNELTYRLVEILTDTSCIWLYSACRQPSAWHTQGPHVPRQRRYDSREYGSDGRQ